MVRAEIFLRPSLNMLVSCWNFPPVCFNQSLQRTPVTSIQNFSSATITTEWLHLTIFIHWVIVLCTVLSPMAIIWDISGGFLSPVQTYYLSFVKDRGLFCWRFPSLTIHACYRGEQLQYWLPVRLNATIATIYFFFKFVMRKSVKNCLNNIYILPGCGKLFGRVVYIYIYIYTRRLIK